MRRWEVGFPPEPAPPVGGRPCIVWIHRFVLSHAPGAGGWRRLAWPDGRPLLEQSWPQAVILRIVGDELNWIGAEQARSRLEQPPRLP